MGCCNSKTVDFKPGTRYSEIKEKIRPFDVIGFRGWGSSKVISKSQELVDGSGEITHVGIVVTPEIIPMEGEQGKLYIWESTLTGTYGGDTKSIDTKHNTMGSQIRDLEKLIDVYDSNPDSKIFLYRLNKNPLNRNEKEDEGVWLERVAKLKKEMKYIYETFAGSGFDCCNIFMSLFACCNCLSSCNNNDKLFCMSLAVKIYQTAGLIDNKIDPNIITPVEFVNGRGDMPQNLFSVPLVITREWPKLANAI